MIPRHWQEVDFAELERRLLPEAAESVSGCLAHETVTGRCAHETATVKHPVAYPPRHPATNIGE